MPSVAERARESSPADSRRCSEFGGKMNGSATIVGNGAKCPHHQGNEGTTSPSDAHPAVNGEPIEEESGHERSSSSPTDSVQSKDEPQQINVPVQTQEDQEEKECVGVTDQQEKNAEDKKDKLKEMGFFTLKVNLVLPGVAQPLEVTIQSKDTVNELLQYAVDRPECCYRTCMSVKVDGKRLDNFTEVASIEGLKDGTTIELVEEPYTVRDVWVHIQHLQELLGTRPLQQALSCTAGMSLSFLSCITRQDPEEEACRVSGRDDAVAVEPPPYCLPAPTSSTAPPPVPLTHFFPADLPARFQVQDYIRLLCYSNWNPPPMNRRLKGDLVYLDVITLEGDEHCITACPSGFYLNRSVGRVSFDPSPKKTSHLSKHLVTLLSQISPLFRKNFAQFHRSSEKTHPFEVLPVPYPVYSWLAPKPEHKPAVFRTDEGMGTKVSTDEFVVGQLRDWNEELQTTRELPTDSLMKKLFRDRALFKIHADFVQAAVRGAMAAVDGHLHPLNPGGPEKNWLFLWNNIFFSMSYDSRGSFKDFGGDEAAFVAANYDRQGLMLVERVVGKDIHVLLAVIVDYRGHRVFAQSLIPGLLQREDDTAIMYGSLDCGKTFTDSEKARTLLKKYQEEFHLRPHKILTNNGKEVEIPVSVEIKGVEGADGRLYVLDLFRLLPPDANYADPARVTGEGEEKPASELGLRHKLSVLRPELLEAFINHKSWLFLRIARNMALKYQVKPPEKSAETDSSAPSNDEKEAEGTKEEMACELASENDSPSSESTGTEIVTDKNSTGSNLDCPEGEHSNSAVANGTSEEEDTPGTVVEDSKPLVAATQSELEALLVESALHDVIARGDGGVVEGAKVEPRPLDVEEGLGSLVLMPDLGLVVEKDCTGLGDASGDQEEAEAGLSSSESKEHEQASAEIKTILSNRDMTTALNEAARQVGADSAKDFDIRFNTDIFAPGLKFTEARNVLNNDRQLAVEAARFLVSSMIPRFVRDCVQLNSMPVDGRSLKIIMHARGINMRYLGKVAEMAEKREDLCHLLHICISEMIVRVARRKFRRVVRDTPLQKSASAVAHFLNCFLGFWEEVSKGIPEERVGGVSSASTPPTTYGSGGGQQHKRKNKRKKNKQNEFAFQSLTPSSLWADMCEDLTSHYRFKFKYSSLNNVCSQMGIHKMSILREFCLKSGIQLCLREYEFSSPTPFSDDDIVALVPVVKHTNFKASEAVGLYDLAQSRLAAGQLPIAHDLLTEAVQIYTHVYGPMHADIVNCYKHLARINYAVGDVVPALSYQHKVAFMSERLLGVDHPDTISAYFSLALYCHAAKQTATALRLLYRVKYLLLLITGPDHPEVANCDLQTGFMLHSMKDFTTSLAFLQNALALQCKYFGKESIQVALTHHFIARSLSAEGDFRTSLQHEKTSFNIYNSKLGGEHLRTKESAECLKQLTEKAVMVQKKINQMTSQPVRGRTSGGMAVAASLPGSWWEVLTMTGHSDHAHSSQGGSRRSTGHRRRNKQQN